MILPNNIGQKPPLTLDLYSPLVIPGPSPKFVTAGGITATAAWNCLLANYYGTGRAGLTYLNSDQAFIDAWKTAIDMYGVVFSGITLIVNTGNGLPVFHQPAPAPNNVPPGCGLTGISLPNPPPVTPAFPPDCHTPANMDCAAETTILSYFLTPGVGGKNAKATAEDGLSASDGLSNTFLSLSAASVKWLSSPAAGPTAATTYLAPGTVVLGGLQFAKAFSSNIAFEGCANGTCPITPEDALYNVLQNFFAGTSASGAIGAPPTANNNGTSVSGAPINYLQIYDSDILYAGGLAANSLYPSLTTGGCTVEQLMSVAPPTLPTLPSPCTVAAPLPTSKANGMTAQAMLNQARLQILTMAVTPP